MMDSKQNKDASIGYDEKKDNLSVRIEAHKKYSNLSLEDWFSKNVLFSSDSKILDIGCGNGNFFPSYSEKLNKNGLIIGLDKSKELLLEAKKRDLGVNKILLEWDMNQKLPFIQETFDCVISSFAIYYVDNVLRIVEGMKRVLKTKGEVVLIGPTNNNAKELYDFNENIFGFPRDAKIGKRTNRIEKEFYPIMEDVFDMVSIKKIPSKILFPNEEEFVKYYVSTLLFEESIKKSGSKPTLETLYSKITSIVISKEMIVVSGKK